MAEKVIAVIGLGYVGLPLAVEFGKNNRVVGFDISEKRILELKNGLLKFIYHETSMIIPLANAIFDDNIEIKDFLKVKKKSQISIANNLTFRKVDSKIFPIIKIKDRINEFYSTSIIINAVNEILVDQFLQKKIPFLAISKLITTILNDRNYKKYAIKRPKNIKEIYIIDRWARNKIMKKLN